MTVAPPDVTPDELLARARALRPLLTERAAETEALRRPPEDVHQAVDDAGFYRLLMPRRYGGLPERTYPFHERDILVTACDASACIARRIHPRRSKARHQGG